MLLGIYKTYEELEESLNIDEVNRLIARIHKKENDQRKFAAALKGIKLDGSGEEEGKRAYEAVKRRAEAKRRGISEEQLEAEELGIKYTTEE